MIYLGTYQPDIELGCYDGADEGDLEEVLQGNEFAASSLLGDGFPLVNFVGRNIPKIVFLDEPDFTRDHTAFRI